jgi:hypothetical protein
MQGLCRKRNVCICDFKTIIYVFLGGVCFWLDVIVAYL